jgi:hypothetical protein
MMSRKYKDYFSIDENYFPSVNEEVINRGLVKWQDFYPHDTFLKLLKNVESVLSRKQKLSIWVEGAYGTGKSYAVLTVKKMLEDTDETLEAYFDKYHLEKDLCNKLCGLKARGKILTVHRYGSSSINSDRDLIMAVQESINEALKKNDIQNKGESSLKEAIVKWLSNPIKKGFFDNLIKESYQVIFEGDGVDELLGKLNHYNKKEIIPVINKILTVADLEGFTAFRLDMKGLTDWIRNIIKVNNLMAIFFVWDEFTEYFEHNKHALTGFQEFVELSETDPFYLMIVTHKSEALFHDTDSDKKKILDRFVKPTCNIELPENMAFKLMGAAMKRKEDPVLLKDWEENTQDLIQMTSDSRKMIAKRAQIEEKDLKPILPIHPYTALLLKNFSTAFDSNQRSMFDFIKNNRGEDVQGFQWFIENHGPLDDWNLLTVDLLWNFFYEQGREHLSSDIRMILDSFKRLNSDMLNEDDKRVLKAVLLLQAISGKVGGAVELFLPNQKNISHVFDGTNLEVSNAVSICERLVKEGKLFKRRLGGDQFEYSSFGISGDEKEIEKNKEKTMQSKKTHEILNEVQMNNLLELSGSLNLRYQIKTATADNFKRVINEIRTETGKFMNRFPLVLLFAKDDQEVASLKKKIGEYYKTVSEEDIEIIFLNTNFTPLGSENFQEYAENLAHSSFHRGKDDGIADQYDKRSREILEQWKNRICKDQFVIHTNTLKEQGKRLPTLEDVKMELKTLNKNRFPLGIEQYSVIENMFTSSSLAFGAQCGVIEKVSGTYKSGNAKTKLECALVDAWEVDHYWKKNESLHISKLKIALEDEMKTAFENEGKISVLQIYDLYKTEPYGFLPCNLTAFIMGFLLKEYANDTYRWSNGLNSDAMSPEKVKEMIKEILDFEIKSNSRYKEKYIVAMTDEERHFSKATAQIFKMNENECSSIEQIRDLVRNKLKNLVFPLWTLKELLGKQQSVYETDINLLFEMIDLYSEFSNSSISESNKSESSIAMKIGQLFINNEKAANDLGHLISDDNCRDGMKNYLEHYQEGILPELSQEINDSGNYMLLLKEKFDASEANWLWHREEVDKKIDELIIEYSIISESNLYNTKSNDYKGALQEWCEKLKFLKVPYEAIKNEVDKIKPFLEMLYSLKKTGFLKPEDKKPFLDLLKNKKISFNNFNNQQKQLFKKIAQFSIHGLTDDDIVEIYKQIPNDVFAVSHSDYTKHVDQIITDYKEELGREKLRKFWKDNTETANAREWSNYYKMPIMCMIQGDETEAKKAFAILDNSKPSGKEVEFAINYFGKDHFFSDMSSEEKRNQNFIRVIVKKLSTILNDSDEVKNHLSERLHLEPFDWYQSTNVENEITELAHHKYITGENKKALDKIKQMDPDHLKKYLERLVMNNMQVGIEIINDN